MCYMYKWNITLILKGKGKKEEKKESKMKVSNAATISKIPKYFQRNTLKWKTTEKSKIWCFPNQYYFSK